MAYRPQGGYPCTNIMLRLSQRPTISCYRYQLCTYGQETCSSWSSTTVRPFSTTLRSCGPLYVPLRTSPALNSLQLQLQIRTLRPLWLLFFKDTFVLKLKDPLLLLLLTLPGQFCPLPSSTPFHLQLLQDLCPLGRPLPTSGHPRPHLLFAFWDTLSASALWTPCPPQHHQLQSFSLGNKSGRRCNSHRLARRRRLSPPAAASALWTPCPPQHHQLQSFSLGNKSGRRCNSHRLARRRRLSPPAAASALWTPCPPQHHQL